VTIKRYSLLAAFLPGIPEQCRRGTTKYSVETKNEFSFVQETGDITMITIFVCATLTNDIIVALLLYYWNVDVKDKKKHQQEKLK